MGENTEISWCDHTFCPWWGCMKVSPACKNCYAEAFDNRVKLGGITHWGANAERRHASEATWKDPVRWNKNAEKEGVRRRVFCSSMSDVFEDRADLVDARGRLFSLISATPHLDWLLLTKRPENMQWMLPWTSVAGVQMEYPWPNVWLGVTAENNECAELRIPMLRATPAVVRFVSCEPILEHIGADTWDLVFGFRPGLEQVHWLIVGDESGHGARPAQVDWVRTARDSAERHGLAFHFKQWCSGEVIERNDPANTYGITGGIHSRVAGYTRGKIHLPILDGRTWAEFPR